MLLEEARGLDTKATVLVGFGAVALTFLLNDPGGTVWWAALAAFGASLACALGTLWPHRWQALRPAALAEELGDATPVVILGQLLGTKLTIFRQDRGHALVKSVWWMCGVAFLVLGTGLATWATIIEVRGG